MDWFRTWHGAPTDSKWLVIARRAGVAPGMVSALFWALLDYASQHEDRGSVTGFDIETYAVWSGWDEAEIKAVISEMNAKGVITEENRLAAWDKRQPQREDDSAERVRRHRRKSDGVTETNVTQRNAEKRSVTHGNAPEQTRSEQTRSEQTTTNYSADAVGSSVGRSVGSLLAQYGVKATPHVEQQCVQAIEEHGLHAVEAGLQAATESDRSDWKYIRGCIRNKASGKPPVSSNGPPLPRGATKKNGAVDISGVLPEEVLRSL